MMVWLPWLLSVAPKLPHLQPFRVSQFSTLGLQTLTAPSTLSPSQSLLQRHVSFAFLWQGLKDGVLVLIQVLHLTAPRTCWQTLQGQLGMADARTLDLTSSVWIPLHVCSPQAGACGLQAYLIEDVKSEIKMNLHQHQLVALVSLCSCAHQHQLVQVHEKVE